MERACTSAGRVDGACKFHTAFINKFVHMKKLLYIIVLCVLPVCMALAQRTAEKFDPKAHGPITTDRPDGRYISSRGVTHAMLKNLKPAFAFNPDFTQEEFFRWKEGFRAKMKEIMRHPEIAGLPEPKLVDTRKRDGYRVEKWEVYPLPECVSTFLVLIPDGVTREHPAPGVICIPGTGGSKESLAAEPELEPNYASSRTFDKRTMALHYVKAGLVAVSVDNPGVGELSDLEKYTTAPHYNYDAIARELLEMGWSYLGYNSYVDMQVLKWMKTCGFINKERIILSGHSLGTEAMMVMGVLDPSIYAVVYSDFLCRTLERMIVLTEPYPDGSRPYPNSIRHLIPNFLCNFDFPDIVSYFAPTPIIFTEGGLERDFKLVQKAYEISGHPENVKIYYYPKFSDPKERGKFEHLPEGISYETYFSMTNVDPPMHYFKYELVIPWVKGLLGEELK